MHALIEILKSLGITSDAAIPLLAIIVLAWGFIHAISADNPIDFWQFFAVRNPITGEWRADADSLGKMIGVVVCLFVCLWTTYKLASIDPWVLGVCLVYLGGVSMFSTWMRQLAAKRYGVSADPAEAPGAPVKTTTTTVTEAAK